MILSMLQIATALVAMGAAPRPSTAVDSTLQEISRIINERFYSKSTLDRSGWERAVTAAADALRQSHTPPERERILASLVQTLQTSHTQYLPRSSPTFWELTAVFEDSFQWLPEQCDVKRLPPLPIQLESIGVFWKYLEGRWYVGAVLKGSPADRGGLRLGDEIVLADGRPFEPVGSFSGKSEKMVRLSVRRTRAGPEFPIDVLPAVMRPQRAFLDEIAASARLFVKGETRIGYVRVLSWAGEDFQQALHGAVAKLNADGANAFVLDLRDGQGGAAPHFVSILDPTVPSIETTDRDGRSNRFDAVIRKPAVLLVNRGTRSGKEVVAYAAKKHGLATLMGERTAGAVLTGTPFCLSDGSLLYVAVRGSRTDGEVLEGRGVEPDRIVPFDIRYAGGTDIQLETALEFLAGRP
jgi:carboxyl-terminal processing protease